MEAICINVDNSGLKGIKVFGLTKGKKYQVKQSKEYDNYFDLENDFGIIESYRKERFEVMESLLSQCLNKCCELNQDGNCIGVETNFYKLNCTERIKPQHTLNYAEEQLEHAMEKETRCYNEKCNRNDKNGKCQMKEQYYIDNCTSRDMQQPILINYEEEYKKLKEEKEELEKNTRSKVEEINKSYEAIKKENEKYRDYIKDSNKVFDKLTKENEKLENTRDALVEANNRLKKEKELIESQLENEFGRNGILKEKLTSSEIIREENEEFKAEINQLRDDVQKANFKLKEYDSKLPQLKELVVKLIRINEILASNIYVEGLED